ncbi:hypothetical protein V8G54_033967 [Vigna mungo]|uniref:Uncharacterized protein n=1 Tax=Vigna mungo TaxID=3915 RepID=A0AAQ3MQB3_VIGMU
MTLGDANFILQVQLMLTVVPSTKNPSFGFIFETLFSSLHYLKSVKGERKRSTEKSENESERERELFVMVRWEGMEEMQRFIWRKKRKDECMRRPVGFPNGPDCDRSKAQKDLNGPVTSSGPSIKEKNVKCWKCSFLWLT